jgi:hypothetical protein
VEDQGAEKLFVLNAAPDSFEELRAHVATILSDYEVTLAVPEPAAGGGASSDKATLRGDEGSVSAALRYVSLRSLLLLSVCVPPAVSPTSSPSESPSTSPTFSPTSGQNYVTDGVANPFT